MTERPTLARAATDLLASQEPRIEDPSVQVRARAIAAIAEEIAASARRRRRVRVGLGTVAAAAVAIGVLSARPRSVAAPAVVAAQSNLVVHGGTGVTIAHGGATSPAHEGLALQGGDRVLTAPGAKASLTLTNGTALEVEGASELAVVSKDDDHVFALSSGAATFHVAKVTPGARFVVRTRDAEVEVRGTVFRVEVVDVPCAGTTTRVSVTEGAVVVRRAGAEWRVSPDERWPASCGGVDPLAATPSVSSSKSVVAPHPAPAPSSDLATQNDVFAEAMTRKRKGDRVGALTSLDRLLTRWPSGPLAESASIERMRLLDGPAAKEAAKAYLVRWPNGAARTEARAILSH